MSTTMLYKSGHQAILHGVSVDFIIVDDADVKAHSKKGWLASPKAVKAAQDKLEGKSEEKDAEEGEDKDSEEGEDLKAEADGDE